jgi:hypothetical protein
MSEAALQQLKDAQAALSAALTAHDLDAIHEAGDALATAVAAFRTVEGWRGRPGLRDDLSSALKDADATRGLVNELSDRSRRRLDRLVGLSGQPRAVAYGRTGTLR